MRSKLSIYLASMNLFFVFLGIGLVIPVMPMLRDLMELSGTTMGMLVSTFAISQLIFSPITGSLTDKIGAKKIIVIGMFLFSISELIFGLSQSVSGFYLSRIIGGISAAFVFPAVTAYVAKSVSPEKKAKAMGVVSASISAGFIVGPGLGGILTNFGIRVPFFLASLFGFLGFFISLIVLQDVSTSEEKINKTVSSKEFLVNRTYLFLLILVGISAFGLQAFESIYGVMTAENFGFTTAIIAIVITTSGIISIIFQLALFSKLVEHLGEVNLMIISFFFSSFFIGIISFTTNKIIVILSTFIIFLSFNLIRPSITTYLSKSTENGHGVVNGLNSTFTSFGNIMGPMIAGFLFDINHFYPYYISAVTLFVTGILALLWKRTSI